MLESVQNILSVLLYRLDCIRLDHDYICYLRLDKSSNASRNSMNSLVEPPLSG